MTQHGQTYLSAFSPQTAADTACTGRFDPCNMKECSPKWCFWLLHTSITRREGDVLTQTFWHFLMCKAWKDRTQGVSQQKASLKARVGGVKPLCKCYDPLLKGAQVRATLTWHCDFRHGDALPAICSLRNGGKKGWSTTETTAAGKCGALNLA